jgi:nucleoside-diphosphate-sugar epimerase
MKQSVFITGATGCIGSYVLDRLLNDPKYDLYLLVRDPSKLPFSTEKYTNVHLVQGELESITSHREVLGKMDMIIHIATAWGDSEATANLNVARTIDILDACDPKRFKHMIYFSTASILGPNNQVISEAETEGTWYVRSKYRAYHAIKAHPFSSRVTVLFPTLVFGGDRHHPYSHICSGLLDQGKWAKWIRHVYMEARFHFLHAYDIASVVIYLLNHPVPHQDYALGNPVMTGKNVIETLCRFFETPMSWRIKLTPWFVLKIAKLFRIQMAPWDRHCLSNPIFEYNTVAPDSFGMTTKFPTLESTLIHLRENPPLK